MKSSDKAFKIEFITDKGHPKRAVAFLVSDDKKMNAKNKFDNLSKKMDRHLRTRFDAWIDGKINKKWFHGWDNSEYNGNYVQCFVFKYDSVRFYGFLCNPKSTDNKFQLCVLINNTNKYQHETEERYLRDVEGARLRIEVHKNIKKSFGSK